MSFFSKLKKQLQEMGIKVEGNYVKKKDKLLADVVPFAENSEDRDFYQGGSLRGGRPPPLGGGCRVPQLILYK